MRSGIAPEVVTPARPDRFLSYEEKLVILNVTEGGVAVELKIGCLFRSMSARSAAQPMARTSKSSSWNEPLPVLL
jgi:hypothetical protein